MATDVVDALHVPLDQVDIDAERSERYHEVGFLVRFHEPSLGTELPLCAIPASTSTEACDRRLMRGFTDDGAIACDIASS